MDFEKLLVATKFAPPKIGARYIVREHLLEVLRRERMSKLVLVPGSAGFGKTVLLAQWRQELMKEGVAVVWLSLGPDERHLATFSTHLFAALARLGASLGQDLSLFPDHAASTEAAVAAVINQLTRIDDDLYLILDDYHHVEDPLAHALLQKVIDLSPGNLHVVIASRASPPLSTGRLRAMGQVAELDCAALPFDLAETRAFLGQAMGAQSFTLEELREIQDLTNGWPACVQLLSILLRAGPERRARLRDLAWRSSDLQTYLSEDVVDRLPPETAQFMESISICRRFNAELAAEVSGAPDAREILQRIEDENLLMSRVESDDRSPWFRFHPLFGEFLVTRLHRRGQAAVEDLHRRASAWCASKDLVIEAVRHATLARDLDAAVTIFERAAPASWRIGHLAPMLHLLNTLPSDSIRSHPRLLLLASLATALTGRAGRAAMLAEQFRATGGELTDSRFRLDLIEATIAFQRDELVSIGALLGGYGPADASTSLERYVFLSAKGYSLAAAGHHEAAHRLLDDHPPPLAERNEDLAILAEGCRAPWLLMQGRAGEARRVGEPLYERAARLLGPQATATKILAMSLAETLYELDLVEETAQLLANRLPDPSAYATRPVIDAALCRARLTALQSTGEAALVQLDEQIVQFRSLGLQRATALALAEQVRIALSTGQRARAAEAVRRLAEVVEHAGGESTEEMAAALDLSQARLALHERRHEDALGSLQRARTLAIKLRRERSVVTADLLTALALEASGAGEQALQVLAQAVRRAAPLELVRTFVDEGAPLRALLSRLDLERLDEPDTRYVAALIAAFTPAGEAGEAGSGGKSRTPLPPREVQILGLVATGMSNKRIALTLNITLETVKWNLKNVFLKLGVSSRYDAMIWARRQGLIK